MTERIYTHRTRDGLKARIICTDFFNAVYPVVALVLHPENKKENVVYYTSDLKFCYDKTEDPSDLFECNPWNDVAVDTPIWVKDPFTDEWLPRHFCKFENGNVFAWVEGATSHSTKDVGLSWACATTERPEGY